MTDPTAAPADDPTTVVVVIDRSGSMAPLRGFVVEGANQLLDGLDPAARVTIVQFDSHDPYEVLVDNVPAAEVTPIEYAQYQPRRSTPLFDAVGEAITRTTAAVEQARAGGGADPTVVLAIISDGFENASTRFTREQVRQMIERVQQEGWTVTYIGLGHDVFIEGRRLGIDPARLSVRARSRNGTLDAFRDVSAAVSEARLRRRRGD